MQQSDKVKEISLGNRAGKRYVKVLRGDRAQSTLASPENEKRMLQITFLREIADNPELHRVGPGFFEKLSNFRWVEDHWECELTLEK